MSVILEAFFGNNSHAGDMFDYTSERYPAPRERAFFMTNGGSITLENSAPVNALAVLLEAYLFRVLSLGKRREDALRELSLTVGIAIADSTVEATVRFAGDTIWISDGMDGRADVTIRTTAARALSFSGVVFSGDVIGYLTDGRRNALDALSSGELDVRGMVKNLPRMIRLLKAVSGP